MTNKNLTVLIYEIRSLFKAKPNEKMPTNMFSLVCDKNGYWKINVTDDWHKWLKKGYEIRYRHSTPELACEYFLEYLKKHKIIIKKLQY